MREPRSYDYPARARHISLILFLIAAALVLIKVGRDTLYFQGHGVFDLPKAYFGVALLSAPFAIGMVASLRILGVRRARIAAPALAALTFAALAPLVRPGSDVFMTGFFILVPLVFGVVISVAWLLAGELLDAAPRAELGRSYARLGAAFMVGGSAAGVAALLLAPHSEPSHLILAGAITLAAAALLIARIQQRFEPCGSGQHSTPSLRVQGRELADVARQSYFTLLFAAAATAAMVGVLVDFQFYLAASSVADGGAESMRLFAVIHLVVSVSGLIVQFCLLPILQRRVGIHGSLMVLPLGLMAGMSWLLISGTLLARSTLRVVEGGLKASVHRSSWEQTYLPFARGHRPFAKIMIDGIGARAGEGVAALIVYLSVRQMRHGGADLAWMTELLLFATVIWLGLLLGLAGRLRAAAAVPHDAPLAIPLPDG